MILSLCILWIFLNDLLACEFGERVTNQFDQFKERFERCQWYELLIGMQRMYLIFLLDVQQPTIIQSYAGIAGTRETFKKV